MEEKHWYEMVDARNEEICELKNQIYELADKIETKDTQIEFLVEYIVKNINKDFRFSSNKDYYSKGSW